MDIFRIRSKKGNVLLQVLMVSAIIATIAAMVMRLTLTKSTSVQNIQVNNNTAVHVIQGCMAEVESIMTRTGALPTFPYFCKVIKTVNGVEVRVHVTKEPNYPGSGVPHVPNKLQYTIDTAMLELLQR